MTLEEAQDAIGRSIVYTETLESDKERLHTGVIIEVGPLLVVVRLHAGKRLLSIAPELLDLDVTEEDDFE